MPKQNRTEQRQKQRDPKRIKQRNRPSKLSGSAMSARPKHRHGLIDNIDIMPTGKSSAISAKRTPRVQPWMHASSTSSDFGLSA